jgi:hypothetical protein
MTERRFTKLSTKILKGKSEGSPVYTAGSKVRLLGLPVTPDGSIALSGKSLTFMGMFPSASQFTVLDYDGDPLKISVRGVSIAHVDNYLDAAPVMLPVRNPELFEGITMIIPVSNVVEAEDRVIDIYIEPLNP